ncbi:MAG: SGNH/GDSL hydrolase family protein [Sandaracinaceae bacterium]
MIRPRISLVAFGSVLFSLGCGASTPPAAAPTARIDASNTAVIEAQAPPDEPLAAVEPAPVSDPREEVTEVEVEPPVDAPELPLWDRAITLRPEVEARVREIASRRARSADVFIKVGDSATVSRTFMRCFAFDEGLALDGRDELRPTIEAVRSARVQGGTSFTRDSEAAGVGWSVSRVLRGSPTPIAEEVRALSPRFALVMFGGNDIELGRLGRYETRMATLVERLAGWGVVPVLSTIPRRNDDAEADAQVPRYNAVVRALAESQNLPLVEFAEGVDALPRHGLASDGVHPNSPVVDGRAQGCDFTAHGLEHGQNARNLLNLRMLQHLRELLAE